MVLRRETTSGPRVRKAVTRQRRSREEARGCYSTRSSTTSWRTINGRYARPPNGQLAGARACCAGGWSSPTCAGSHRGAFLRRFGRPQGDLATTIRESPRGGERNERPPALLGGPEGR